MTVLRMWLAVTDHENAYVHNERMLLFLWLNLSTPQDKRIMPSLVSLRMLLLLRMLRATKGSGVYIVYPLTMMMSLIMMYTVTECMMIVTLAEDQTLIDDAN